MPPLTRVLLLAAAALLQSGQAPLAAATIPPFPGAEGYGAETAGGRGGQGFAVTTLADSGPGSLREALLTPGPRLVVFRVGGATTLASDIDVSIPPRSFLAIADQTAPGDGIQVRGWGLLFQGGRPRHRHPVPAASPRLCRPRRPEKAAITIYGATAA